MKLYDHQQKIVNEAPAWTGLWFGTGGGKTITILSLIFGGRTLVICPKTTRDDETWQNNLLKLDRRLWLIVKSKEEFRRDWQDLPAYDTVIIDECHTVLGVTGDTKQVKGKIVPKTSQLFEAVDSYLQKHPPKQFYMCSATPASKPMNVWAIARLFGNKWDFFKFREKFYIQRKIGFRTIWLPRNSNELKEQLAGYIKQLGYVGRLQDWFDVPEQTHITKYMELSEAQKKEIKELEESESDPMWIRTKKRSLENGCIYELGVQKISATEDKIGRTSRTLDNSKIDYILEKAEEFPKMLIFANYIAQVEHIAQSLEKAGFPVRTLTGATKDRKDLIQWAESSDKAIVIAQAGISAGYELKTVPCVIFASKSYRYLDYEQGLGRVLRADALKKNLYIHLVVKGGVDETCHKAIMAGEDFQEKIHEAI
jgi:hypothetical protein